MRTCVRAFACVRACVCARERECVYMCVRARMCTCVLLDVCIVFEVAVSFLFIWFLNKCAYIYIYGGGGGGGGMRGWVYYHSLVNTNVTCHSGKVFPRGYRNRKKKPRGRLIYVKLHCRHQNDTALRRPEV